MALASTISAHLKGVRETVMATYDGMPNYWRYIVGEPMTTTAIAEKFVLMTGLATAEKVADSAGVQFDEITTPYNQTTYTDIFAIGVELSQKQIGTDQSGKLRRIGEEFAYSLNYARETLVAGLLNNHTDATNFPIITGVALCSASQPSSLGLWSNLSTAAALDITSLERMVSDRKNHLTLKGQKWLKLGPVNLITSDQLEITAGRLLNSIQQPGGPDNDVNELKRRGLISWTPGNQLITDTNAYWMVPQGKNNPMYLLKGDSLDGQVQEDKDIRTLQKLMVAAMDEGVGCLYPAGLQGNIGA